MKAEIILMRHAKPTVSEDHPSAWDLSPQGRKAASEIAKDEVWRGASVVYTSPMRKAVQTAEAISARWRIPVYMVEDLREVDRPREGGRYRELLAAYLSGRTPEGWEDPVQAEIRFRSFVEEMSREMSGRIAIVSHGTILTLFIAGVKGVKPSYELHASIGFCDYALLDPRGWRLVRDFRGEEAEG